MKGKIFLVGIFTLLNVLVIVTVLPRAFGISSGAASDREYTESMNPYVSCPPSPSPVPTPTPTPGNDCMTYHGNLIMTGNINVYIINWFDGEQPPANYVSLIQQFYNDLSGTQGGQTFYNILDQYPDHTGNYPTGVTLAGTWEDDSTPYPCNQGICKLDAADILAEVETAMSQNFSWPQGGSYANYFAVYTLDGAQSSVGCAFHGASSVSGNAPTIYGYVQLAGVGPSCPPPTIYPNCAKCDSAINRSAHELFEAVTDPLTPTPYPSGWYNVGGGGSAGGGEVADLCGGQYGPTPYPYDNGKANQDWVSGSQDHYYLIQEMWSNSADACTTSHT